MVTGASGPEICDDGALQRDEMASGLKVTGDISGFRAEGWGYRQRKVTILGTAIGIDAIPCDLPNGDNSRRGQPPSDAAAGTTLKKWTRRGPN